MKKLLSILLFVILFTSSPAKSRAADCYSGLSGNKTINPGVGISCTLPIYVDGNDGARYVTGTDNGSITMQSGTATLNSNSTLAATSLTLTGGSLVIAQGAQIKVNTPLYVIDADSDGYSPTQVIYAQSNAPTNGRRLNLATNFITGVDCYDSNANAKPGQTSCFTTHRGDSSFDYDCSGSGTNTGCTSYNVNPTPVYRTYSQDTGSCNNCNMSCGSGGNNIYYGATIGCGSSGATCTSWGGKEGGSCSCVNNGCSYGCSKCTGSGATTGLCNGVSTGTQSCK